MRNTLKRRSLYRAALTALSGFGVMNIFQVLLREETSHLRGLYSYWTASVGDALCLPIMTAGVFLAKESLELTPRDRVAGMATGAAAALLSGINQYNWLADPSPELNWTLIAPHTFNIAGWYHAGFAVVLPAYIGYQLGALVIRWRSHKGPLPQPFNMGLMSFFSASGLFALLLVGDNIDNTDSAASTSTLASLGITILILVIGATYLYRRRASAYKL